MKTNLIIGVFAMAAVVVASNILVQHLLGDWLTWGALTYPVAFLVTDTMNRLYGAANARKVVLAGFAVGVACSFVGSQIQGEFGPLVTLRVAIASGLAFLSAQLLDVTIFNKMRARTWWQAPLASTLVGSTLDTAIFFSLAFAAAFNAIEPTNVPGWAQEGVPLLGAGPVLPLWVSLAVADWSVKLALAALALVPFRLITAGFANAEKV